MKDILVATHRPEDASLIVKGVPASCTIRHAPDLDAARIRHAGAPADLVMADIELFGRADDSKGFSSVIHPFVRVNPFVQFVVLCRREQVGMALKAVKEGAAGYLLHPLEERDIRLLLPAVGKTLSRDYELDFLRDRFWKTEWLDVIRSRNRRMRQVFQSIRAVAPTVATVLLLGETGTGKGMMARLIHWHSQRFEQPFISVHCGAIPDNLIESELFGHEKGAFTGADRRKPGKFEMARGGTIFLDEIGTISASAQIKLLQVLQDGTFSRIGADSVLTSDVRVIAATNADLTELVEKSEFRKDLFYRLNIFPVEIPPLKDRVEDIEYLVEIFLKNLNVKYGKEIHGLHRDVMNGFRTYEWPGNIRELENLLERAYIIETSSLMMPQSFPLETMLGFTARGDTGTAVGMTLAQARQQAVDACETAYLTSLLEQTRGRIGETARLAGITPRQLNRLLNRHGIDKTRFKGKTDT